MREISIVLYNPAWPKAFEAEKKCLLTVFSDIIVSIDHIGSTIIKGMAAKPVIDILISVTDINLVDHYNRPMQAIGYTPYGEFGILGRRFFSKDTAGKRTHHIHVFEKGNDELDRHRRFRDYMNAHPVDAQAYADLKIKLAKQYPHDSDAYCAGKDSFIKAIDKKIKIDD